MLKGLLTSLFCSLVLVGHVDAQEVIVAHETKPEAPKQAASPSEQTPSESPSPEQSKPKSRQKKSRSSTPTAEEMRMAGALAAERLENRNVRQAARTSGSDSEPAATEPPTVSGTPKQAKKESRSAQTSASRRLSSPTTKPEPIGAVRPTMIESGRQEPSVTPSGKAEARGEHTPAP
jgi:hypothetical protein